MKKIICCLLVAVMLSACGGETKNGDEKRVGDVIMVNGELGVVFDVTANGRHGKVMSVSETKCNWNDAKDWCVSFGPAWRLPTKDELKEIYRNKDAINSVLSANDYTTLMDTLYWSSGIISESFVWYVSMRDGYTYNGCKSFNGYVRAVSAF